MKLKPIHCPCCGYFQETSEDQDICPSCFFGGDKDAEQHRATWQAQGRPWMSALRSKPKNWNPDRAMAEAALAITKAKTKGRPPRML